nr:unnamed protein product [Callosobruchus analis]
MQRREILNLQSDRRRLKARINNLNSLLSYLQEQYGITESAASIMSLHYKVEHIYKTLLVHSQVKGSEYVNVTGLNLSILYCSTLSNDENEENLLNTPEYARVSEKINEMDFLNQENLWINDKCIQGRQSTRKFIKTKRYSHIAAKKLLKIVPSLDAFGPHIYDTYHVFETIKLILQKYFTKRIQHELKNMKDSNKRVRANLTKSLLF